MLGAALMCALGAIDDIRTLHPLAKLLGQIAIATLTVHLRDRDRPRHPARSWASSTSTGCAYPVTVIWIVAIVNIVNFIDGLDGLAAGFCGIAALTFSILSASLGRIDAAAVSAILAGAAIGFLRYNFHPATIIMGDSGSLMMGYLLATIAIEGVLKTAAAVSLVFPLVILALPILDTSFVILKRLKYRQPIYQADNWHFHHRFSNIGFSQRRTALTLYAWCTDALGVRARHPVCAVAPARMGLGVACRPRRPGDDRARIVGLRRVHARDPQAAPSARAPGRPAGGPGRDTNSAGSLTIPARNSPEIGYSDRVVEELVLSRSRSSGILRRARSTVRSDDRITTAGRPAASGAMAGIQLLVTLIVCVASGLGLGWAAGSPAAGAAVGAVIGIPASFYLVYRTYRDL